MAAYNKIQQFVEDLTHGVHDMSADNLTIALTTLANKPAASDAVLGDITQIDYSNIGDAGGTITYRRPTITSCDQTTGTLKLLLADLTLTAVGDVADFGAIVLYNDTPSSPTDPLISWWELASDITTMGNGETLKLDFDDTNGAMQLV